MYKHIQQNTVRWHFFSGPSRIQHLYLLISPYVPQRASTLYLLRQHSLTPFVLHTTDAVPDKFPSTVQAVTISMMMWLWTNGDESAKQIDCLHDTIWKEVYMHLNSMQLNSSTIIYIIFKFLWKFQVWKTKCPIYRYTFRKYNQIFLIFIYYRLHYSISLNII